MKQSLPLNDHFDHVFYYSDELYELFSYCSLHSINDIFNSTESKGKQQITSKTPEGECLILWNESDQSFDLLSERSQQSLNDQSPKTLFSTIQKVIEIQPRNDGLFHIILWNKNDSSKGSSECPEGLSLVGPLQNNMLIPKAYLSQLIRESLINNSLFQASDTPLQRRQKMIADIFSKGKAEGKIVSGVDTIEFFL